MYLCKIYQENNCNMSATIDAINKNKPIRRNIFGDFFENIIHGLGNICCAKQSSSNNNNDIEFIEINIGEELAKNLTEKFANDPLVLPNGFQPVIQISVTLGRQLYLAYVESILRQEETQRHVIQEDTELANDIEVEEEEDNVIKEPHLVRSADFDVATLPTNKEESADTKIAADKGFEKKVIVVIEENPRFVRATTGLQTNYSSIIRREVTNNTQDEFMKEFQIEENNSEDDISSVSHLNTFNTVSDTLPVSKQEISYVDSEDLRSQSPSIAFQTDFPAIKLSNKQKLLDERLAASSKVHEQEDNLLDILPRSSLDFKIRNLDDQTTKNEIHLPTFEQQNLSVEDFPNYNNIKKLTIAEELVELDSERQFLSATNLPLPTKRRWSTQKQQGPPRVHGQIYTAEPESSAFLAPQKTSRKDIDNTRTPPKKYGQTELSSSVLKNQADACSEGFVYLGNQTDAHDENSLALRKLDSSHISKKRITGRPQVHKQRSVVLEAQETRENFFHPNSVHENDLAISIFEQSAIFHRAQAQEHFQRKKDYYKKGKQCLAEKSHQRADEYFREAKQQRKLYEEANNQAVVAFLYANRGRNPDENTIDLHGLYVKEAIRALDNFLDYQTSSMQDGNLESKSLTIITGRGKHSVDGIPKIKPAVINRLKKRNLKYFERNPGSLTVQIFKY